MGSEISSVATDCCWFIFVLISVKGVLLLVKTWKTQWMVEEVSRGNLHIEEGSKAELLCWHNSDWTSFSDGE